MQRAHLTSSCTALDAKRSSSKPFKVLRYVSESVPAPESSASGIQSSESLKLTDPRRAAQGLSQSEVQPQPSSKIHLGPLSPITCCTVRVPCSVAASHPDRRPLSVYYDAVPHCSLQGIYSPAQVYRRGFSDCQRGIFEGNPGHVSETVSCIIRLRHHERVSHSSPTSETKQADDTYT